MDYEMIENKVKEFCESMYKDASEMKTVEGIRSAKGIAFGGLMFACNNLFPCFNNDLSDWWNEKMWYKFEYLVTKIEEKNS